MQRLNQPGKSRVRSFLLASSLALATIAGSAQAQSAPSTPSQTAAKTPQASDAAVQVVNAFMAALASGHLETARQLMAPDATVVANGQVLGNRDGYIDGAAKGDAAALRSVERVLVHRDVQVGADSGWVLSEKRVRAAGKPDGPSEAVIETMLLARTPAGWKITHVHWSTRKAS
jgi:ketosteroid isomerase-like protein